MTYFSYTPYSDEYTSYIPRTSKGGINISNYQNDTGLISVVKVDFSEMLEDPDNTKTESELKQEFIDEQEPNINITEITLDEFKTAISNSKQLKRGKYLARQKIRNIKDIEDDLTDNKIVIQNMFYFMIDLYKNVLTDTQRTNSAYKDLMDALVAEYNSGLTLRANLDDPSKLFSILEDEKTFAEIVKDDYLVYKN